MKLAWEDPEDLSYLPHNIIRSGAANSITSILAITAYFIILLDYYPRSPWNGRPRTGDLIFAAVCSLIAFSGATF
jgi:hypothetical protein